MALSTGPGTHQAYGLLRQYPHIALRVSPTTSQRYKDAALTFISFCHGVQAYPETAADYDMWKSAFPYVIASITHFFPPFKGHLPLCRAALAGWEVAHVPKHIVPMNDAAACLVGAQWASQGKHRLAARLRSPPSEMLNLAPADVTFSNSLLNNTTFALVVRLWTRSCKTSLFKKLKEDWTLDA